MDAQLSSIEDDEESSNSASKFQNEQSESEAHIASVAHSLPKNEKEEELENVFLSSSDLVAVLITKSLKAHT